MRLTPKNLKTKFAPLTASQWRSLGTGTLALLATANQQWQHVAGTPGLHVPFWLTTLMQALGVVVPMLSRSLDRSNSGTGGGLAGATKVGESNSGATPPDAGAALPVPGLLPALAGALTPIGQYLLTAYAASLVSDQHRAAATDATLALDRTALLAGVAAKADAAAGTAAAGTAAAAPVPPALLPGNDLDPNRFKTDGTLKEA